MSAEKVPKKEAKYRSIKIEQVSNGYSLLASNISEEDKRRGLYDVSETFVFNTPQALADWIQANVTKP